MCDCRNDRAHWWQAVLQGLNTVSRVQVWSTGSLDSTRHSKQWTKPRHSGQEQNRWDQRQGWTQDHSMNPKSINESATETGYKLKLLSEKAYPGQISNSTNLRPIRRQGREWAGDQHT
ncbi:hypothetical protein TURU_093484 [Turdus rufiventris]|nr:hypothetical protein TURU_093484 [Turdus rufiventris]